MVPHYALIASNGCRRQMSPAITPKGRSGCWKSAVVRCWPKSGISMSSPGSATIPISSHVDRHLLHDLGGSRGLLDLKSRGLAVHNPELTFATPDHAISTARGRAGTSKVGQELLA